MSRWPAVYFTNILWPDFAQISSHQKNLNFSTEKLFVLLSNEKAAPNDNNIIEELNLITFFSQRRYNMITSTYFHCNIFFS